MNFNSIIFNQILFQALFKLLTFYIDKLIKTQTPMKALESVLTAMEKLIAEQED